MKSPKTISEDPNASKGIGQAGEAQTTPALLLTVPQAAQQMGLSPAMVYKLILTAGLPVVKLGRSTRIVYTSLVAWLKAREDEQRVS